ncbi:T-cell surface glycoprotein CD3 delta chain [Orycteropus afer afer]|uniref:T-cell surface glycoprotein CD3 delta chain n=1 Tax=Orycteropus afer afer TaxID=1230840 RepID=A0A8B6ZG94_ORYAF|nr:T-cell surface glycoprotein CD3 delta chain [Orycteropus afer afer]
MEHSGFLVGLILAAFLFQISSCKINVEEHEDKVILSCDSNITWIEGTKGKLFASKKSLDLGKRILDPQGVYQCKKDDGTSQIHTLQVYYRMCQSCVEVNSAILAGVIITDIIATLLLALGVYCFAAHETGRLSKAAEIQTLLRNDQLYQPLRDRDDAHYSHLGGNWHRNK